MDRLKEYKIPFIGLKVGTHDYEFKLDAAFFEAFESSVSDNTEISVYLKLEKKENMMDLEFTLSGTIDEVCDRCGADMKVAIESEERLVVKYGEETGSTDDEILVLGPSVFELDLSQYIYEYAMLSLPTKKVHQSEKDCDQDALARLNEFKDDENKTDPRWDALKNIK